MSVLKTIAVIVLSFSLGSAVTFLSAGQHSVGPQAKAPPQEPNVDMGRMPIVPQGFGGTSGSVIVSGGLVILDGYACLGCTFQNVTLRYGGGVFGLSHANITGTARIELVGAAANTVAFLSTIGVCCYKRPEPLERPRPNVPIIETAKFEKALLVDLRSPYGQ